MGAEPLDRIHIGDLLLRCIIGVRDWEREAKQNVLLNMTLYADLSKAAASDDIGDTVDYVTIKKNVIDLVEGSSFYLVEALAQAVAEVCLRDPQVRKVDVRVEKPGALRFARTVAVEMTREQE
ncbi:MAG: dihydroneopterin aldolase [Candidatus Brocadiia bacterium]